MMLALAINLSCIGDGRLTEICDVPIDMTSESLTLGTHSLDLSLNNSFAKDPRMLRCGKEELSQVKRVCVYDRTGLGCCEPAPYN